MENSPKNNGGGGYGEAPRLVVFFRALSEAYAGCRRGMAFTPPPAPLTICLCGDLPPAAVAPQVRQAIGDEPFLLILSSSPPETPPEGGDKVFFSDLSGSFHLDQIGLMIETLRSERVEIKACGGAGERHVEELDKIRTIVDLSRSNVASTKASELLRLRCCLRNLPLIVGGASRRVEPAGRGFRAVVCGAGPSLAASAAELRAATDKALVIAVGHAAYKLVELGVAPDIIAELDPVCAINWRHDFEPDSLLATSGTVAPLVAERFKRILWCQGDSPSFNNILRELGIDQQTVRYSRTVTVSAIDLAARLGATAIALIGNDLCVSGIGETHIGESASGDPLFEIEGNEGGKVLTNPNFHGLKNAIEWYLESLAESRPELEIINCTVGGAKIEHTVRGHLAGFLAAGEGKPTLPEAPVQPSAKTPAAIAAMRRELRDYRSVVDEMARKAEQLRRELAAPVFDGEKVARLRAKIQELSGGESSMQANRLLQQLLGPIGRFVDNTLNESPEPPPEELDADGQLRLFAARYRLVAAVCGDFLADIAEGEEWSQMDAAARRESRAARVMMPYRFASFRSFTIDFVRKSNPEYAAALESGVFAEEDPRLRTRLWFQQIPWVEYVDDKGVRTRLSEFTTMRQAANQDINRFAAESAFNPDFDAVVFPAPGNWIHVLEFSIRYPDVPIVVVDPWPRLFNRLISTSFFIHRLSGNAHIICADDKRFPDWRGGFARLLNSWAASGRRPKEFRHPHTGDLPGIPELLKCIRENVAS